MHTPLLKPFAAAALMICTSATWLFADAPAAMQAPVPLATFADDLKVVEPPLDPSYATAKHPRLLFSAEDKPSLQQKAKANPAFWQPVLNSSKGLASVPAPDVIKSGAKYWRIEGVQSGALAYFVTGEKKHLDAVLKWMIPHCQEPIWGTGYRDNMDLQASWYLYHLSIAYDILHNDIGDADRKIIVDGLASHARAIYDGFDPSGAEHKGKFSFDQNHTYIPAVALTAASLALLGEVPEAKDWLKRAYTLMNRCRYVLGDDGYYYEGYGYWMYALHWHVRYADLISRAMAKDGKGHDALDLPIFRENWKFGLHMSLPGNPGAFDAHDTNRWSGDRRPDLKANNFAIFWDFARAAAGRGDASAGVNRSVGDMYNKRAPDLDYPAAAFLWYSPKVEATPLEKVKPYNYFADHDVVAWRSGWDENATALLFRCGPPEGHNAAAKLKAMIDWTPNAGHVHPDIGGFYLFAKKTNLVVSTGYTAEKWTRDHNTLLIDGKGQGIDGTYWNDRGAPYDKFNECRITANYLSDDYGYVAGSFGTAYFKTPDVDLTRRILVTKRYVLVVDGMSGPGEHKLTWMTHTEGEFKPEGKAFVAKMPKASLAVFPLAPQDVVPVCEETVVKAGTGPGKGVDTQRGHHLSLTMKDAAKRATLINLLVPLGAGETAPEVHSHKLDGERLTLELKWPDGKLESIDLNLAWAAKGANPGQTPATISTK